MRRQNPSRICSRKKMALSNPFRPRPTAKGGRIDGFKHYILRMNPNCVARIPRAYAVEMALPFPRPQAGWPNAERREQREEGREQRAASSIHCIFTVSRDHVEKVMKIRNGHQQILPAYLRCSVTTTKSAEKYLSPLLPKAWKAEGASKRVASSIHCIFTGCRGHFG